MEEKPSKEPHPCTPHPPTPAPPPPSGGAVEEKPSKEGGVDPHIAAKTTRGAGGSLALGQDQDCLGGCFSPSNSFDGEMAVVRGGGVL